MNDTTLLNEVEDKGESRPMCRLIGDTSGVTAIEYALIAALIAVAAISEFSLVGTYLSNTFSNIASCL
jgi:pilus assembly protein Flp/PilA